MHVCVISCMYAHGPSHIGHSRWKSTREYEFMCKCVSVLVCMLRVCEFTACMYECGYGVASRIEHRCWKSTREYECMCQGVSVYICMLRVCVFTACMHECMYDSVSHVGRRCWKSMRRPRCCTRRSGTTHMSGNTYKRDL